jgi:hypothetical protein
MKEMFTDVADFWNELVDRDFFTDKELELVTSINGYSVDTLSDCLYARYGYYTLDQMDSE